MTALRNYLDLLSSKYEKILILGDFNVEIGEENMKLFCENYNLKSFIKLSTYHKNPKKLTCIDLILTKVPRKFQKDRCVIETGLFNLHLMTVKVMRKTFKKICPRVIKYTSYIDVSN